MWHNTVKGKVGTKLVYPKSRIPQSLIEIFILFWEMTQMHHQRTPNCQPLQYIWNTVVYDWAAPWNNVKSIPFFFNQNTRKLLLSCRVKSISTIIVSNADSETICYLSLENNNLLNLHSVNKIFEYSAAVNVVEKTWCTSTKAFSHF